MKSTYRTQNKQNWQPGPDCYSRTVGPSETVPDDTLSIKQILAKHVRGMRIEAENWKTPLYDGDCDHDSHDLEAVNRLDLAEKHELSEVLKADIERRKADIKAVSEATSRNKAVKAKTGEVTDDDHTDETTSDVAEPHLRKPKADKGRGDASEGGRSSAGKSSEKH